MRFHVNAAPAATLGEWSAKLPAALADVRAAVAAAAPEVAGTTLYTGKAGVAYALARASRQDAALAPLASRLAAAAAASPRLGRHVPESVMDGQAGVAIVEAIVTRTVDPSAPLDGPLSRFSACCAHATAPTTAARTPSDEVLYGRAGTLLGALTLNRQLGTGAVDHAALVALCRAIIESGRALSTQLALTSRGGPPLFYTWPEDRGRGSGDPYLGAAHGLTGIVHALLCCWSLLPAVDNRAQTDVLATLDAITALETDAHGRTTRGGHWPVFYHLPGAMAREDGPALAHFCHSSPGVAMMLCKAYEVTSNQRYLQAAQSAGELVWEHGLLRKGPGLCHGVSGNAYALLAVWRATGDATWLDRAYRFAAFIADPTGGRADWSTPDHPWSLFEGAAGALCLLSDLQANPAAARFPFFEV